MPSVVVGFAEHEVARVRAIALAARSRRPGHGNGRS